MLMETIVPSSKDPAVNRQKANEWRLANPEKHREANRDWMAKKRAANPDWAKAVHKQQRERLTPEQRAAKAQKTREWRAKNPDYQKEWARKHRGRDPLRAILSQAKMRARKLSLPYDLTRENLAIPQVCPVLGIAIDYKATGSFNPASPSIDRIIPDIGYVATNCRVISNRANILKRDAALDELRALVAYMERELA